MTSAHDGEPGAERDAALLAELGELISRTTEFPAEQRDIARELFVWRTVDAELAELTQDSLLDAAPTGLRAAGSTTRAGAQPRLLTFEVAGLAIEAEVDGGAGGRRLIGQVVPAGAGDITLQQSAGEQAQTRTDDHGRFVLPLPGDEVRMRLRYTTGKRMVETAWVLV